MLVLVLPFPSQATPGVVLSFWIVTMTPFLSSIASFLLPMLDLMPREVICWKDTCMIACIFGKTSFALGRGCQIVFKRFLCNRFLLKTFCLFPTSSVGFV